MSIPHYAVLVFLWLAFMVTRACAFFAILATGRYPRALFDFNVGVLRWSWRVGYYAYGALGTDQYPPFSLDERPDYPAHLSVDYPEHLSRRLVLVKWWLLALPHYLVVGILLSGGVTLAGEARVDQPWWVASTGLIGLLVLVAAVVLLWTGRYPQPLYDLVLGLNRWVLRVAAYAGLMTDDYPPFRLDQGGHEAGSGCLLVPATTDTPAAPTPAASPTSVPQAGHLPAGPAPRGPWSAGRVVALVVVSLLVLASLALTVGGAMAAWADRNLRDDAGYVMTDGQVLATGTHALVSTPLEIHTDGPQSLVPESVLGRAKLTAVATGDDELFIGIAPTREVDDYLAGVAHARVTDVGQPSRYVTTEGGPPATLPDAVDVWVASSSGTGTVAMTWPVEDGDWTLVVMNSDAGRGVEAEVAAGATVPWLDEAVAVCLSLGGTGVVLSSVALVLIVRSAGRDSRPL